MALYLYAEFAQKLYPFVNTDAFVGSIRIQINHPLDFHGVYHPCTGNARRKSDVQGRPFQIGPIFDGIQNGVLFGMECQRTTSFGIARATVFGEFFVTIVGS